jgi:DHA1 family bicyclomycin/chloramphenicol resistance-like MFS transporter
VPHMMLSFGSGLIVPNSNAGAVGLYPRLAGTASSLTGLVQMGMGALGTVVVAGLGLMGSRYVVMPLVVGLLPFALLTVLSARLLRPRPTLARRG